MDKQFSGLEEALINLFRANRENLAGYISDCLSQMEELPKTQFICVPWSNEQGELVQIIYNIKVNQFEFLIYTLPEGYIDFPNSEGLRVILPIPEDLA